MKIIDLLNSCLYEKIEEKINLHYGTNELSKYKELYLFLKNMKINTRINKEFFIYIIAFKECDENDIKIDNFDENDVSLYYDVSGYEINSEIVYSIASSCYSDFLQYTIDKNTLNLFSYETILAHCFWEVTSYSFEDNI